MRKILVLLDCDTCRASFPKLAAATGNDPLAWLALADDLEYDAEQSDWHCYRGKHTCTDCVLETVHPQQFQQS